MRKSLRTRRLRMRPLPSGGAVFLCLSKLRDGLRILLNIIGITRDLHD